jgi:predicted GH43/DUF377 family glycosyl hydrolase
MTRVKQNNLFRKFSARFAGFIALSALIVCLFFPAVSGAQLIGFNRDPNGPLIPAANSNSSWHGFFAANPVAIEFNNTYFLYSRGIAVAGADSEIGVWTEPASTFDGVTWNQSPASNPIIFAGGSGAFDQGGIYDPSAVVFNNQVYFYYEGQNGGSNIGLATSSDGLSFTKKGEVLTNAGTPFAVVSSGTVYLFYTRRTPNNLGYEFYVATSTDGVHFATGQLVFAPSGVTGTFDQTSVSTVRVWYESPYYYMVYGGSPTCDDYPEAMGLARSTDLINWTRYPNNPVLLRGPVGGWDEAGLWSGSMIKANSKYYMFYEGAGSQSGAGSPSSNQARNVCYGGYGSTSWSQIGVATAPSGTALTNWTPTTTVSPNTNYNIQSQSSGLCMSVAGGAQGDGVAIQQSACSANSNELWTLSQASDGFYEISSVNSGNGGGAVLGVPGQAVTSGVGLDQETWNGGVHQQWLLVPTGTGTYEIVNRNSSNSISIAGASSASGAAMVQLPWAALGSQQWELNAVSTLPGAVPVVTLSAAPATISPSQSNVATVTVVGSSGGVTPTGGVSLSGGGYVSSTVSLNSSGVAAVTIPAGAFSANGTIILRAIYSGDANYAAAAGSTTVAVTSNYVLNPGFEANGATSSPSNWTVWSGDSNTTASFTESGGHSGSYRLTQYSASPEQTYTSQTISVPNGTYSLSVWVMGGAAQTAAYLDAKNYGGSELEANVIPLETGSPNWHLVTIPNIVVTTGTITIGAYSYNPSPTTNDFVSWDDFALVNTEGKASVSVSASPSNINAAQSTSITVSVSGASGTPTGAITLSGAGYVSAPVTLSAGSATITIPAGAFTETGTLILTAAYDGDAKYAGTLGFTALSVSAGTNYVINPSFETNGAATPSPSGWSVWSGDSNVAASYTEAGGHTGGYRLTQYSTSPEQTYTYQSITVPNGTYSLSAWVMGGGAQAAAYLSAKNYGGSEVTSNVIPLETGYPNWEHVIINNITITTGTITIGAYSYNPSPTDNDWVSWDDFSLTP